MKMDGRHTMLHHSVSVKTVKHADTGWKISDASVNNISMRLCSREVCYDYARADHSSSYWSPACSYPRKGIIFANILLTNWLAPVVVKITF